MRISVSTVFVTITFGLVSGARTRRNSHPVVFLRQTHRSRRNRAYYYNPSFSSSGSVSSTTSKQDVAPRNRNNADYYKSSLSYSGSVFSATSKHDVSPKNRISGSVSSINSTSNHEEFILSRDTKKEDIKGNNQTKPDFKHLEPKNEAKERDGQAQELIEHTRAEELLAKGSRKVNDVVIAMGCSVAILLSVIFGVFIRRRNAVGQKEGMDVMVLPEIPNGTHVDPDFHTPVENDHSTMDVHRCKSQLCENCYQCDHLRFVSIRKVCNEIERY